MELLENGYSIAQASRLAKKIPKGLLPLVPRSLTKMGSVS